MTPAEFHELIIMANALASQHADNLISMIFAYVIAGHFVGAEMTRA